MNFKEVERVKFSDYVYVTDKSGKVVAQGPMYSDKIADYLTLTGSAKVGYKLHVKID